MNDDPSAENTPRPSRSAGEADPAVPARPARAARAAEDPPPQTPAARPSRALPDPAAESQPAGTAPPSGPAKSPTAKGVPRKTTQSRGVPRRPSRTRDPKPATSGPAPTSAPTSGQTGTNQTRTNQTRTNQTGTGQPRSGQDIADVDTGSAPPIQRSAEKTWFGQWWPILLAGVSVLLLLGTVTTIGVLSLRPSQETVATLSPEPTGLPVLPQTLGEYTLGAEEDPSAAASTEPSAEQIATGNYYRNGQLAVIVAAVRPAGDSQAVIDSTDATAIREAGGAICGRTADGVHDLCVASRRSTSVTVIGWRGQSVDELAPVAVDFAGAIG
ncbi:hypothetical protein [Naumannella halotolerans]|uniref:hypothetical protein n=1 Tax=Naumannella halotolerans TaxID=993414 RepID=UPI001060671C|nr:hypothetical protein [Naumannella halotolerans]